MAGVIPKHKLTSYQRWNIGSLEAKSDHPSPSDTTGKTADLASAPPGNIDTNITPSQNTAEETKLAQEEARSAGYSAGYEEGLEAARQEMATTVAENTARYAELLGNLQVSLAHLDQHVAEQVLGVALEVASQVLRGTINCRPESLLPVVREAIAALPLHHAHVVLRANPVDASIIRQEIGGELTQTGSHIVDDPEISPGGCMVVAGASEVDATIETRWKRVLEAIGVTPSEWMNRP
jgi:flagellar assembly protein FliH